MANEEIEFSDEEVSRLVFKASAYIGETMRDGVHNSVSVEGARYLARYAEAELRNLHDQIFGKNGKAPNPVMRQHRLKELQRRFPLLTTGEGNT